MIRDNLTPEQAANRIERMEQSHALPPTPINGVHTQADMVLTARSTWTQSTPPTVEHKRYPFTEEEIARSLAEFKQDVARRVSGAPNPLRELAAALLEFADRLDANGVIPVGINVRTQHRLFDFTAVREDALAVVETSILGVRREWVEQHEDREAAA